jgi:hypothetical protein
VPGGGLDRLVDVHGHDPGGPDVVGEVAPARARAAVDEYFAETRPQMLLNRIDFAGRIGVKIATG